MKIVKTIKNIIQAIVVIAVLIFAAYKLWPLIHKEELVSTMNMGDYMKSTTSNSNQAGAVSALDADSVPSIEVEELRKQLKSDEPPLMIDVRDPPEWEISFIQGSVKMPLGSLSSRYNELPKDKNIVIICHSGNRSAKATSFLMEKGYFKVYSLKDGINAWAQRIDRNMRTY